MKPKPMTIQRAEAMLSAELKGKPKGNVHEWRTIARMMWAERDRLRRRLDDVRQDISALLLAEKMRATAMPALEGWMERVMGDEK